LVWLAIGAAAVWMFIPPTVGGDVLGPQRLTAGALVLAVLIVVAILGLRSRLSAVSKVAERVAWLRRLGERRLPRSSAELFGVALLIAVVPWVVANESRPLIGDRSVLFTPRIDQYFVNVPELEEPYVQAVAQVKKQAGCAQVGAVGLVSGPDKPDYLIWVLLRNEQRDTVVKNVAVSNVSQRLSGPSSGPQFKPCTIISIRPDESDTLLVETTEYQRIWQPPISDDHPTPLASVFLQTPIP
jgi:hypothetical protein